MQYMARVTDDKKDYVIQLRVNGDVKKFVSKKSRMLGKTESEYIRDLLKREMLKK